MATGKRCVPPGARRKETTDGPSKNSEDSQRLQKELVQDFIVELRSEIHYGKCKVCIQLTNRNVKDQVVPILLVTRPF